MTTRLDLNYHNKRIHSSHIYIHIYAYISEYEQGSKQASWEHSFPSALDSECNNAMLPAVEFLLWLPLMMYYNLKLYTKCSFPYHVVLVRIFYCSNKNITCISHPCQWNQLPEKKSQRKLRQENNEMCSDGVVPHENHNGCPWAPLEQSSKLLFFYWDSIDSKWNASGHLSTNHCWEQNTRFVL